MPYIPSFQDNLDSVNNFLGIGWINNTGNSSFSSFNNYINPTVQVIATGNHTIQDGVLSSSLINAPTRLILETYNNSNSFGSSFRGRRFRGDQNNPSGIFKDDTILHFAADGYNNNNIVLNSAAMIFSAAENFTTGANGTYFRLRLTQSGSNTLVDRFRITDDGKIGISNDNPLFRLDVSGAGNFSDGIFWNGNPVLTGINNLGLVYNNSFEIFTGKFLKINTMLSSGIQNQNILFSQTLPYIPSIVCEFENNIDNFIYSHAISSITVSGFFINFSDILSNSGYKLNILIEL